MLEGYSLSGLLPADAALAERFWYWRGASGQAYIHSIYCRELCPRLAGAIYLIVHGSGATRHAVAVGRLGPDGRLPADDHARQGREEIHVHLLARDGAVADRIEADLREALNAGAHPATTMKTARCGIQLELLVA